MITKLTKEQEAKIPEYIEKYIRVASEPIDRSKIGQTLEKIYGKKVTYVVGESIQNTIDLIKLSLEITGKKIGQLYSQLGSQLNSQLDSQLSSQLGSQLDSQLYSQLSSQLDSQLYSQLRSQLDSQLGPQLDSQLDSQLYSQLRSQLNSQLYSQLDSQLGSQLGSQLYSQLYSKLYSQLGSQLDSTNWSYYVGNFWIIWLAWYSYGKYIGVKFDEKILNDFEDIVRNISPIVIFVGEVVFICEKPLVRWENKLLHSDQKMAIEWKDGTGFYYLDGVKFEEDTWKKVVSKKMTFKEIMDIEISDQRTVALKYNPEAIIKENAKLVHKDTRNNELYLIEGQKINDEWMHPKIWFLKMLCPTGRVFVEGVPPDIAEKNPNASAMQAYLCDMTLEEYLGMKFES